MNHRNIVLGALGAATLLAPATLSAQTKIGYIYVSPVGDAGWTFQHDQGRKEMEANLKGQVTTKYIENVQEGADADRAIRSLVTDGCKIIFTTSFGYMNPTVKIAAQFPDVHFFHATGYKSAANLDTYNARFYEGRYLNGVVAGRMTKTHIAGYVAAFPIPEVVMGINAFTRGMRSVDPQAKVRVIWTNSWFDPGKEREAASTLVANGADMITHHTDSTAVVQVAEEQHKAGKNVWAFSYHSDMSKYGPTAQLTGTTHVWGDYYTRTVKAVLAGNYKNQGIWGGFREGMIKLAPLNKAVPPAVQKEVARLENEIKTGKLAPFAGPVVDQAGKVVVAKGATMGDADINKMDFYVKGVDSQYPKK
jgi:simple sugar transport system substrate-binding protein